MFFVHYKVKYLVECKKNAHKDLNRLVDNVILGLAMYRVPSKAIIRVFDAVLSKMHE